MDKGPDHEELRIMRGLMFGLPISLVLWLLIGVVGYGFYRLLSG